MNQRSAGGMAFATLSDHTTRSHQKQSEAVRSNRRQSEAIGGNQK